MQGSSERSNGKADPLRPDTAWLYRLQAVERRQEQADQWIRQVTESFQLLGRLEAHHAETRSALVSGTQRMDGQEARLRAVESALPLMRLTSRWVMAGVAGIVALVLMAVGQLVVSRPSGQVVEVMPSHVTEREELPRGVSRRDQHRAGADNGRKAGVSPPR